MASTMARLWGMYNVPTDADELLAITEKALALDPNLAEAHYNLAVAYRDAGDPTNARRSVLRALEVAPHYQRAQDLLLELRAPASSSRGRP